MLSSEITFGKFCLLPILDYEITMSRRICRCCGEPMAEKDGAFSWNPNVCASCSSMAEEIDQPSPLETDFVNGSRSCVLPHSKNSLAG